MKDFILEFINPGTKISKQRGSLCVSFSEQKESVLIPISDIHGVLILSDQINLSTAVISTLLNEGVCIQFLNEVYMPFGVLAPYVGNRMCRKKFLSQLELSNIQKDRMWQKIVKKKIFNQSQVLLAHGKENKFVEKYFREVKKGDAQNHEAQAARIYWVNLFGINFRRRLDGFGVNALLNYGYAILRSAVARYTVATGLNPSLGLFHKNLENPFCLVDDLMEPFRPIVDYYAYNHIVDEYLTKDSKIKMISILEKEVSYNSELKCLRNALKDYCYNFSESINHGDYRKFNLDVSFNL